MTPSDQPLPIKLQEVKELQLPLVRGADIIAKWLYFDSMTLLHFPSPPPRFWKANTRIP